ncbi:MAG: preprotein translocase subunit YajC [Actinomycetaceae bacterium]|nr:preprotein translocase subunit YajC [Actinomycetaceae bacterium]
MTFLFIVLAGILFMWWMSSRARQQQLQQMQQLRDSLEPGMWVRTASGFYGIISDIDGEVVVLQNPAGDESYWDQKAILAVGEPPFATEDEETEVVDDGVGEEDPVDGDSLEELLDETDIPDLSEDETDPDSRS